MSTLLPTDLNNNPIPAVRFKNDGAHQIDIAAESARNDTAFGSATRIISLFATEDAYIAFGGDAVTATDDDHFFPAGIYYDVAIGGGNAPQYTHIAVLAVESDGMLYISEKE